LSALTKTSSAELPYDIGLSFDDGYGELIDLLSPVVDKLRTPPIVFIPTDWIGKENRWDYLHRFGHSRHLNQDEILRLSQRGVLFGSHGASHRSLTTLSQSQRREELLRSKETLEDLTGKRVTSLAYPYGQFNKTVIEDAQNLGYENGFTMNLPDIFRDSFRQGRVPVYRCDTQSLVRGKLPGHPLQPLFRFGNSLIRAGGWLSSKLSR
jgi:peptidoglycan/xylan/chitin deacetylase (PgdA/CDA1 family)